MKPIGTAGTKISTSLWLSFGAVMLVLVATLVIYAWQTGQTSQRTHIVSTMQALDQATWQMRTTNADIALHLSDYVNSTDQNDAREMRDSETAFDRAALIFDQLAPTGEIKSQSQNITATSGQLTTSTDEVMSLAQSQQTALVSFRGTAATTADLMQGMLVAIIGDNSSSQDKLATVVDMNLDLQTISTGINDYVNQPDPAIPQKVAQAGQDFEQLSTSFRSLSLLPLESSWMQQMQDQVQGLLADGTEVFQTSDSLSSAMVQFRASSDAMDALLTGKVQPLVDAETLKASEALTGSANSAAVWLLVLGIVALLTALAAVLIITRRVTGPIRQLISGADLVASGRIEHRFNADTKGEFGQVAVGLNRMLDNLKRSRDALGESEELAWALLDATRDAVVLTDLRGRILASNEIAATRFGRSLEQMIDESLYELLSPESAASLKARVAEVARSKKPVHYEDELEGKITEHDVYPVSEHKGEVSRIALFSRDVTMRKWVEDVTEQLARRNTLILESAGEGIFGLDAEGRTTFVNPVAARMHGYSPEELIGKKHHDLVHHSRPDGRQYPAERCPVHATLRDGTVHSNVDDEVFWRKDGTSFQVEYTSTPITDSGRIIGAVITFRDITDRKRVENALRESEAKYRSAVESASSLIIWLDEPGTITDCGARAEGFLGYRHSELVGHRFLDFVYQPDRPAVEEALAVAAKEGFEHDYHFRMVLKSGEPILVSMNVAVARGAQERCGRTICMISGINRAMGSQASQQNRGLT